MESTVIGSADAIRARSAVLRTQCLILMRLWLTDSLSQKSPSNLYWGCLVHGAALLSDSSVPHAVMAGLDRLHPKVYLQSIARMGDLDPPDSVNLEVCALALEQGLLHLSAPVEREQVKIVADDLRRSALFVAVTLAFMTPQLSKATAHTEELKTYANLSLNLLNLQNSVVISPDTRTEEELLNVSYEKAASRLCRLFSIALPKAPLKLKEVEEASQSAYRTSRAVALATNWKDVLLGNPDKPAPS